MQSKQLTIHNYDNCHECPFCEFPNEKGEIKISSEATLVLSKTILSKDGTQIPNPIVARCGVSGNRLKQLNGCVRWFNGNNVISY